MSYTSEPETETSARLPTIECDERGLVKGVNYIYNDDGTIAWRKMIRPEFLAIKKEWEDKLVKKHGKAANEIDKALLADSDLLILLGGIKRLLFLRGYTELRQRVDISTAERCVCTCTITFAPNYETRMQPVTYSDVASATFHNTSGDIAQMFLEATAANRAFVRCVRGFLNINIVGFDEMGPARRAAATATIQPMPGQGEEVPPPANPGFQAADTLVKKCNELGLTLDALKANAAKYQAELTTQVSVWASFQDIPSLDAWTILDKIKRKQEEVATSKGKGK